MSRIPTCKARQYSDQYHCHNCVLAWDINDPEPPDCRPNLPAVKSTGRTVDTLRESAQELEAGPPWEHVDEVYEYNPEAAISRLEQVAATQRARQVLISIGWIGDASRYVGKAALERLRKQLKD